MKMKSLTEGVHEMGSEVSPARAFEMFVREAKKFQRDRMDQVSPARAFEMFVREARKVQSGKREKYRRW